MGIMRVNQSYIHQEYPKFKYPADINKAAVLVNSAEEEKKLKGDYLDIPVDWKNPPAASTTAEAVLRQAVDITGNNKR